MPSVEIRPGDGGKYRWHLVKGTTHRGLSSIQGYDTEEEAIAAAKEDFGDRLYLDTGNGVLVAEAREFN